MCTTLINERYSLLSIRMIYKIPVCALYYVHCTMYMVGSFNDKTNLLQSYYLIFYPKLDFIIRNYQNSI